MRFERLIQEIHRRSVWQVTAVFVGASWAVLEAIDLFIERGLVPEWTFTAGLVLLLIGLPVVIATALVQHPNAVVTADPPPVDGAEQTVLPGANSQDPAPAGAGRKSFRRWLNWRNALLGGAMAFTLLGIAAAVYMLMRSLGIGPAGTLVARDILSEREPIIVADFGAASGDSLLARAVTDALRVDLSQSPTIAVVSDEMMVDALRRMGRDPDAPLDDRSALELAVREGLGAVIVGDIRGVGGGYVLTARLLEASSGETLVPARETAGDSTELIAAIDALSETLRERIGEPLSSIRRSPPLERVSTASLEALRKYSQALRAANVDGDMERADALLEEAIALDTTFAMAYRKLGVILRNQGRDPSRSRAAVIRSFQLRDRLPERERYLAEASYYSTVTGERSRAANAYEALLGIEPDNQVALNNLAVARMQAGDYDEATRLLKRGLVVSDSSGTSEWTNLLSIAGRVRGWAAADSTFATALSYVGSNQAFNRHGIELAAAQADYDLAADRVRAHGERFGAAARGDVLFNMGLVEAARGRLRSAERHWRESSDRALEEEGIPYWAMMDLVSLAELELYLRRATATSLARMDTVVLRFPLEEMAPLDRPYLELARLHADAGSVSRARQYLTAYAAAVSPELRASDRDAYEQVEAALAAAEGRFEDAIRTLQRLAPGRGSRFEYDLHLAKVYDAAGMADSARVAYTRYLEARELYRIYLDWRHRANALERLAQLHDEAGNLRDAMRYFAAFAEQWSDADPELRPRVEAAEKRIEEILRATG